MVHEGYIDALLNFESTKTNMLWLDLISDLVGSISIIINPLNSKGKSNTY